MTTTSLAAAAIDYARRGRAVFPLRPRKKTPLTPHGFKDATTNIAQVTKWWNQHPTANIGVATGAPSGFWSLDIDGLDGEASLRILEAEHGPLPPSVELITGKGRQIYFRYTGSVGCSVRRLGGGLDTRGDGGFSILPPSIHPTGKSYQWSVDGHPDHVGLATAPEWLVQLLAEPEHKGATPPAEWRDLIANDMTEGGRNDSITRLIGYLLARRVDVFVGLELCRAWNQTHCRPPLPDNEIGHIVDSIAAREKAKIEARNAGKC